MTLINRQEDGDEVADVGVGQRPDTGHGITDSRFRSGSWWGYWLEPPRRTPYTIVCSLTCADGVMHGEGRDVSGSFDVSGTYDGTDGSCAFERRYGDGRVVRHRGYYVKVRGHEGIAGEWERPHCRAERFWLEHGPGDRVADRTCNA
jgi:hypothetical protein